MKLLRYGPKGKEKPAIVDAKGQYRCLSSVVKDIDGSVLNDNNIAKLRSLDLAELPIVASDERIGPCVGNVGKFICIGLNYADHAEESNMPIPTEPVVFSKFTSAISGPNDNIVKPKGSTKLDWEVELGLVIGKSLAYADEADAQAAIAGYCVCHDVSEREFQLERAGQWDLGKGCDTFGPIGPYLVTSDEIENVLDLDMWLEVNGKRFQNGSTKTMIFSPAAIVSFLSQYMTLQPGDIVATGTPPGVGFGLKPEPQFLQVGDQVSLGIQYLGEQSQKVVQVEH